MQRLASPLPPLLGLQDRRVLDEHLRVFYAGPTSLANNFAEAAILGSGLLIIGILFYARDGVAVMDAGLESIAGLLSLLKRGVTSLCFS
jgi:hypothetical protein